MISKLREEFNTSLPRKYEDNAARNTDETILQLLELQTPFFYFRYFKRTINFCNDVVSFIKQGHLRINR
jgi:hypothetical protein